LSLSLSYLTQIVISSFMLNGIKKVITWKDTVGPILMKVLNTLIMIFGMYFVFKLFDFKLDTSRTIPVLVLFAVTSTVGLLLYLLGSKVFSPREYKMSISMIKKMSNRVMNGNGDKLRE